MRIKVCAVRNHLTWEFIEVLCDDSFFSVLCIVCVINDSNTPTKKNFYVYMLICGYHSKTKKSVITFEFIERNQNFSTRKYFNFDILVALAKKKELLYLCENNLWMILSVFAVSVYLCVLFKDETSGVCSTFVLLSKWKMMMWVMNPNCYTVQLANWVQTWNYLCSIFVWNEIV